ncbi:Fe3+-hydroxamate ABC transporter substrate-binding protein [Paenibacillus sp. PCH8]|uniref:AraC family transcriptional regulator n=1 Tax=Paenibacillus sp. PCH8 TaxID=2066524 RepID=UPI000CF8E69B|nr:AraC family transcriptional regulator [Paenibacillus sp. PCH8]PQP81978.1 Fe3+-hydroxamate ABC transporter substrate-binding protein [Paenibacillus sp. PCH8]
MHSLDADRGALFFSAFMFRLNDLEQRMEQPDQVMLEVECKKHTFLICEEGEGHLYIGHERLAFSAGCVYPLSPGEAYQIEHGHSPELRYMVMTFDVIHVLVDDPEQYTRSVFEKRDQLYGYPYAPLSGVLEQLYAIRIYKTDAEYSHRNTLFQKWMEIIISRYTSPQTEQSMEDRIFSTIQYVDEHYAEEITVQKLARLADIRPAQYTTLFRQRTGHKPLDYVNDVRIQHAKDWLRKSDEPLRDIASRVGFKDEYYFSRRFRQMTGLSPRQYDRSIQQKTLVQDWLGHDVIIPASPERIMYYGDSAGDLLMLGVRLLGDQVYDAVAPVNVEEAVKMKPDLIIFDSSNEQQYEQFARIAPTLAYNSHATLADRIRRVGSWFGKLPEAEQWLASYEERTKQMWEKIRISVKPGETASVFAYHRGARLFVMGNIGLAPLLYHPMGFKPVGKVKEALAAGRAYKEISADAVRHYAGDHIFVMLPEEVVARQATERLMQTHAWTELPAVKDGQVYPVEEMVWNLSDALTSNQLLTLLPELLCGTS